MSLTEAAVRGDAWSWKATESGEVEGYLSVWNLVDAEDDVVEPGAFCDVIKAWHLSGERCRSWSTTTPAPRWARSSSWRRTPSA